MNVLETVLIVLLIISVIITFVQEPVLSVKYGKAIVTSYWNIVKKSCDVGISIVKNIIDDTNMTEVKNET